jgi:hypothetical protein
MDADFQPLIDKHRARMTMLRETLDPQGYLYALVHDTKATVYFGQSVTYGLAFRATHRG